MKVVAIIQARLNSTRLHGKILLEVNGKSMLEILIERVKKAKKINEIIIATTENNDDDIIEDFCEKRKIKCVRGSEEDVLGRYFLAAKLTNATIIVRITSDNPLIDPIIIDQAITIFNENEYDFVSNYVPPPRTYPDGMAVEVFSFQALNEANDKAKKPSEREHVTFFIWKQPEKFFIHRFDYVKNISKYRFTLDYPEDYEVIKPIIAELYSKNPDFKLEDIINWIDKRPQIKKLNMNIKSNTGWNIH
jgi:spore coat polysaccharide biosynthesis protein SpsF